MPKALFAGFVLKHFMLFYDLPLQESSRREGNGKTWEYCHLISCPPLHSLFQGWDLSIKSILVPLFHMTFYQLGVLLAMFFVWDGERKSIREFVEKLNTTLIPSRHPFLPDFWRLYEYVFHGSEKSVVYCIQGGACGILLMCDTRDEE